MSSAKVSRLVGDLSELGPENGTQFTWNTWIIIIFPNCHNCGYSPISDCQVGDTMSFPLCLVKNHNFYWDVLAVLVLVSQHPPFSDNLRYLCRFAQYSGFPCVVKSWRGIGCDLSSARPETWDPHAVKETGNETVRIGLETNRKTSKSNGKFSFSLFLMAISSLEENPWSSPLTHHLRSQDTLEVGTYLRGAYPHAKLIIMGWQPGWFGGSAVACCPVRLTGTAEETRSHGGNVALCALAQGQHLFDAGFACSLRWNDVKWSIEFLQWVCFVSDFGHLRCHQQNLQSSQSSQSSKFWSQAFWFRRHPTSLLQFPPWSRSGFLMPTWTPSVPRWNYGSYFGGWHQAMDAPFFNIFHISTVDIRGPSWTMVDPDGLRPVEAFTKTSVKRSIVKWSQELILWWMRGWRWRRTGNWSELIGEKGQLVMLLMM